MRRIAAVLLCVFFSGHAKADILEDAWGVLTDPLKLTEGTENLIHAIQRAFILAERLQGKIDADVTRYFDRIDRLALDVHTRLDETIDGVFEDAGVFVDDTLSGIIATERQILNDAQHALKCSGEVAKTQVIDALVQSLHHLGASRPRITFFGTTILAAEITPEDIPNPIDGFREFRDLKLELLKEVKPEDHPHKITDVYAEIGRLASLTACHYKDNSSVFEELFWTEIEFERRDRSWLGRIEHL